MKIIFLTSDLSVAGGAQVYIKYLIMAVKTKNDVRVVEFAPNFFSYKLSYAVFLLKIFFSFIRFRPELIVCTHINYAFIGYIIKKLFNINYVVNIFGVEVWGEVRGLKRLSLIEASFIISLSEFTAKKLSFKIPSIEKKLKVIYPVVDEEKFFIKNKPAHLIEKYGIKDEKILLTVCRLDSREKYKGYDVVIEALKELAGEYKIKYIIAGYGDDIERVEKIVYENKLEDAVIITGKIEHDELNDYYNLCDLFIMPSRGEGFGIVFIEALACGKPVIAGAVDGSVEAVLYGKAGIVINPVRDEVISAIRSVIEGKVEKNLLEPEYLRNLAIENFGKKAFFERVDSVFSHLC